MLGVLPKRRCSDVVWANSNKGARDDKKMATAPRG